MNGRDPSLNKKSDCSFALVREICGKISEAIEEIEDICDEEEDTEIDFDTAKLF